MKRVGSGYKVPEIVSRPSAGMDDKAQERDKQRNAPRIDYASICKCARVCVWEGEVEGVM